MRTATMLVLGLCAQAHAEGRAEKAQALLAARDCDQLLLSFENARPGQPDDEALARLLTQAATGPCAADRIVACSLSGAARRLAPRDVEVLLVAAGAARAAKLPGEAAGALDDAVAAAPTDPRPRVARAELALEEGEPAVAIELLGPVKADPTARDLLARAEAAARDVTEAKRRVAQTEKAAMDAAAKAQALDTRPPGGPEHPGLPPEPIDVGPGGAKEVVGSGSFTFEGAGQKSFPLATRKGRTYRVHAGGWCRRYDDDRSPRSLRLSGSDLRIRIGSMTHGLTGSDDFDFVAESDGATAEVWNAHMDAGRTGCSGSFTVREQ